MSPPGQDLTIVTNPGSTVRPFSWTASPYPGESLMGYVTRIMSVNVYPATAATLALAGIRSRYAGAVLSASLDVLADVATLLGTTREVVHTLAADAHGLRQGSAGDPSVVRRALRLMQVRRVSPLTLRRESWHHAVWDSRFLNFCPYSLEPLRDRCPVCERRLDYRRSLGPTKCQLCIDESGLPTVDLRDYPQGIVQDVDEEVVGPALDLVLGREGCEKTIARLPPTLTSMTRAEVLDILHFMLRVRREHHVDADIEDRTIGSRIGFTPREIAVGFQDLMLWPESADALVDEVRAGRSSRSGAYGRSKEIGTLDVLLRSTTTLPAEARHTLRNAADSSFARSDEVAEHLVRLAGYRQDTDLVPRRQASVEYVVGDRLLQSLIEDGEVFSMRADARKSPILIKRSELEVLVTGREKAIALRRVVGLLGLREAEVRGLIDAGRLPMFEHPSSRLLRAGTYVARDDVDRLVREVEAVAAIRTSDAEESRRLSLVVRGIVGGLADWNTVFEAILAGTILVFRDRQAGSTMVGQLFVPTSSIPTLVGIATPLDGQVGKLDLQGVRAALGVSNHLACLIVASGLLGDRRRIGLEEIGRFRNTYILAKEIVAKAPVAFHTMRSVLEEAGIPPAHVLGSEGTGGICLLWLRSEVVPWMSRFRKVESPAEVVDGRKRYRPRRRVFVEIEARLD